MPIFLSVSTNLSKPVNGSTPITNLLNISCSYVLMSFSSEESLELSSAVCDVSGISFVWSALAPLTVQQKNERQPVRGSYLNPPTGCLLLFEKVTLYFASLPELAPVEPDGLVDGADGLLVLGEPLVLPEPVELLELPEPVVPLVEPLVPLEPVELPEPLEPVELPEPVVPLVEPLVPLEPVELPEPLEPLVEPLVPDPLVEPLEPLVPPEPLVLPDLEESPEPLVEPLPLEPPVELPPVEGELTELPPVSSFIVGSAPPEQPVSMAAVKTPARRAIDHFFLIVPSPPENFAVGEVYCRKRTLSVCRLAEAAEASGTFKYTGER